jgi:hypothetical protein
LREHKRPDGHRRTHYRPAIIRIQGGQAPEFQRRSFRIVAGPNTRLKRDHSKARSSREEDDHSAPVPAHAPFADEGIEGDRVPRADGHSEGILRVRAAGVGACVVTIEVPSGGQDVAGGWRQDVHGRRGHERAFLRCPRVRARLGAEGETRRRLRHASLEVLIDRTSPSLDALAWKDIDATHPVEILDPLVADDQLK